MCSNRQWYCPSLQHRWAVGRWQPSLPCVRSTPGTQEGHCSPSAGAASHVRLASWVNCTHLLLDFLDSCPAVSIGPCYQCPYLPQIRVVSLYSCRWTLTWARWEMDISCMNGTTLPTALMVPFPGLPVGVGVWTAKCSQRWNQPCAQNALIAAWRAQEKI